MSRFGTYYPFFDLLSQIQSVMITLELSQYPLIDIGKVWFNLDRVRAGTDSETDDGKLIR